MFKVNDTVLYGSQGVCRIKAIEIKEIGKKKRSYYVLRPIYQESSTIFVPVDNENLVSKMHNVMSIEEIKNLIIDMPKYDTVFETDDSLRRNSYREILSSGDRVAIASVIKSLYSEQLRRKETGKKLPLADEQILNHAENLLCNELALVLNIEPQQVISFINEQIELNALNR
ncbi:MAG: CarD family transcriptional regulator [Clostridia bacterium]|nr:CarD family transcriptional regulator [Clostridia bacterium]MBP3706493.1 CarD family transcriptional regulator [Clostridia bacterium]